MSETGDATEKPRRGRPRSGITEKRQVRIGKTWDRAEELALDLARAQGTVRNVKNQVTKEIEEKGDIAGYIEEALARHNAYIERQLNKQRQTDQ